MSECTEQLFLKDIENHKMTIIRDDGVHRHIQFKRPETSSYRFDLITWPGHLCYTGDMGTYVFQRLDDMFDFFRTDRQHQKSPLTLKINLGYWTEKLIAVDGSRRGGKAEEFSEEKFRKVINEYRVQWMRSAKENGSLDKDQRRELWESVDWQIIDNLESGGERAMLAAHDFNFKIEEREWYFNDLFEHNFTDYTFHMVWCCYALAWGILQYDKSKEEVTA